MDWRFYTDSGDVDQDVLEEALADHEADVGMTEFGKTFSSLHVRDIKTRGQALALKRLLPLANVQVERVQKANKVA